MRDLLRNRVDFCKWVKVLRSVFLFTVRQSVPMANEIFGLREDNGLSRNFVSGVSQNSTKFRCRVTRGTVINEVKQSEDKNLLRNPFKP